MLIDQSIYRNAHDAKTHKSEAARLRKEAEANERGFFAGGQMQPPSAAAKKLAAEARAKADWHDREELAGKKLIE